MHRKNARFSDSLRRVQMIGWSFVMGLIPSDAGVALFERGHAVLGVLFVMYGLLLAWCGIRLTAEI